MIIRVSEARVREGMEAEFLIALRRLVETFPHRFDGLRDHEILINHEDPRRIRYVSRWRDERALAEYAGAEWATTPVTFPDEGRFLAGPLTLEHFRTEAV